MNKSAKAAGGLSKVKLTGTIAACMVITVSVLLSDNSYLTDTGMKTAGLLVAFLLMLVTEALPVVVTSLLFCGIMPILGITSDLAGALSGFAEPIVFFTLASFGIAAALTTIPLSKGF